LKALVAAFNDKRREPNTSDFINCAKSVTATAVLMAEQIQARKERLGKRCRNASDPVAEAATEPAEVKAPGRKISKK